MQGTIFLFPAASASSQSVLYVDADATGQDDGSSWGNAFANLQDALGSVDQGDEIWVAIGEYLPDRGAGTTGGDRASRFIVPNGVSVIGGFEGTESSPQERLTANRSVLSGDLSLNDSGGAAHDSLLSENAFSVVELSAGELTSIIDGVEISGAYSDSTVAGVALGAVRVLGPARLSNVRIARNESRESGAGITVEHTTLVLSNAEVTDNISGHHGGGLYAAFSAVSIRDSRFEANVAADIGGGVYIDAVSSTGPTGNPTEIHSSVLVDNKASSAGGLYLRNGEAAIHNTRFVQNVASSGVGGGVVVDGEHTIAGMANVIVSGNSASDYGGGIVISAGSATVVNGVIASNSSGTEGGGLWVPELRTIIANTVFWNNAAVSYPDIRGHRLQNNESTVAIDHSVVTAAIPVEVEDNGNNFTSILLFGDVAGPDQTIGTDDDDFTLQGASPAIDAGRNSALPVDRFDLDADGDSTETLPIDAIGHHRVHDFSGSGNATVDIGAIETGSFPVNVDDGRDCCSTEAQHLAFTVFPNPASSAVNLVTTSAPQTPLSVTIFDVLGRSVKRTFIQPPDRSVVVPLGDLPAGLYFIRVSDSFGRTATGSIIKL